MPSSEKDALPPPPSYSESLTAHTAPPRGQTLLDQLTLTRARHIQSVISTHIIPLIETQAAYGIAQTVIALLPSDIPLPAVPEKSEFSFDTADSKAVEVIGFASEEAPKVVRLEGPMNRTEFWRVQAVVNELERVLRECLNASSQLRDPHCVARMERSEFEMAPQQRQTARRFLSRLVPSLGPEQKAASGNPEVGIRQMESGGLVLVKARLEEICLRTMSEFGLYDTLTRQCVIIRVDARC